MKIFFILFLFLISCSQNFDSNYPIDQRDQRIKKIGSIFDNKTKLDFNNKNLFNETFSVISSILPISIIDEKNGMIVTEWGNIKEISKDNLLYKINIYIKDNEFKENNLIISVFKKDENNITLKDLLMENKIKEQIFLK